MAPYNLPGNQLLSIAPNIRCGEKPFVPAVSNVPTVKTWKAVQLPSVFGKDDPISKALASNGVCFLPDNKIEGLAEKK